MSGLILPLVLCAGETSLAAMPEPRILVCFRNDDLSATSSVEHESRVLEVFDRYSVRQSIGVIPLQHIGGATYLSL